MRAGVLRLYPPIEGAGCKTDYAERKNRLKEMSRFRVALSQALRLAKIVCDRRLEVCDRGIVAAVPVQEYARIVFFEKFGEGAL